MTGSFVALRLLCLLIVAAAAEPLLRRVQPERHEQQDVRSRNSFKNMADGCQHVFLDVGSNRGVHVRALYEPAKYPKLGYYWHTDLLVGVDWNQTAAQSKFFEMYSQMSNSAEPAADVCTFGFEANADFTSRLKGLEEAYNQKGYRAKWLTPLAVSDSFDTLSFWREPKGEQFSGELGTADASLPAGINTVLTEQKVDTIDFAQFLQDNIVNRKIPKTSEPASVVMKMDIEGAEFKVLPHLLTSGLMCKGHGIDAMTLEWHEGRVGMAWTHDGQMGPGPGPEAAKLHKLISEQNGKCQPTDVLDIDEEFYSLDNEVLPTGAKAPPVLNSN
jgi:hypothetical protein